MNKSEEQKSAKTNIKTLYESREKVFKLFNDHSKIISKAKYKTKYGEGLKILTLITNASKVINSSCASKIR